jgi:benzoyl-CoA reductase/2-hydroxyglutaryl-CoA dehydratase subunit BcrC/BadD/HgdB
MEKLGRLLDERPEELAGAKEKGKKILGYFCSYVPEEIVHAAGVIPIRLARRGNNAAVSVGNTYLSPSTCPYACSCVGLKKGNRDPYFKAVDFIADAPACMQIKRVAEVWEKYFSVPVIPIAFPRKFYTDEGSVYFAHSLKIFTAKLGEITGKPVSAGALKDAVDIYNRIRALQRRLYEGLKAPQPIIPWENVIDIIRAGFVLDKTKYADFLEEGAGRRYPCKHIKESRRGFCYGRDLLRLTGSVRHYRRAVYGGNRAALSGQRALQLPSLSP